MRFMTTVLAAAAALATTASMTEAQMDLTTLPPEPAEMKAKIGSCSTSLTECIAIAEKETGGVVSSVSMNFSGPAPIAMVTAFSDASRYELEINAMSGAVMSSSTIARFPGWELGEELEMVTTESGLMYFDLEEGEGDPPPSPAATVEVHYTGYLVNGTKFDSSHDRGQTIEFPLNRVIKGWTEGVGSMKPGGKRKLIIPSDLGYGARGAGAAIPPYAMLVFDVELVSIVG